MTTKDDGGDVTTRGAYAPPRRVVSAEQINADANAAQARALRAWVETLQRASDAGDWNTVKAVKLSIAMTANILDPSDRA